jgi:uroporphyrinogen decarboxylase
MRKLKVPLEKPRPDIERFLAVMRGKVIPERVPLVEYLIDNAVMRPILEELVGRRWIDASGRTELVGGQMDFSEENLTVVDAWLANQIAFWYHMGYDFIRVEVSLPLPAVSLVAKDTARGNEATDRAWQGLHHGPIKTWEDFEQYPWPTVGEHSFYVHRYICEHLPEGFGFITCHAGGVYEHASRLLGYENLCYLLHDDPSLVKAVADRLGELILKYDLCLLELEGLSAIFQGDDLGYNTQTLISAADIRKYFLPWHKKFAGLAHERGRPYYLHSCGDVSSIMEDLIIEVGIDGKHSFQDNVLPAWQAKERWGDRIAILGGVDVDKLASLPPDMLRAYVRDVISGCAPGGRFAIGAGNSIPSYIPVENYLTMLDEALR